MPTAIAGAIANGSVCCGFWYYTNDDELTDIRNGTVWSANEWEDGVAITDCFTNFNGGGSPYSGPHYALDMCIGLTTGWLPFCFHHGQRGWIDDWGDPLRDRVRCWDRSPSLEYEPPGCSVSRCTLGRDTIGSPGLSSGLP